MGEDTMTDPGQLDQTAEDSSERPRGAHERSRDTQQQSASRFSLAHSRRAWIGIALSVIALAGVTAALIAIATGGGTRQANSSVGGPSAATDTAPGSGVSGRASGNSGSSGVSKAKSNVTSAAQLAESGGAISLPTNMKSSVLTWQSGRGGTDLAAVSSQAGNALQAAGIRQYSAMKYACAQLAGSVSTAQAGPPIPVATMQRLYAKALAELAKGAADCRSAISSTPDGDETVETAVNTKILHQSMSELAVGVNGVFRSTAEIDIASRQHH
jgi:hypothetical protein